MTKFIGLLILIFSLIAGGCSKATQKTEEKTSTVQEVSEKQEAQPKSNFPQKPIQLIVPVGPGASLDTTARILAKGAEKYLPNGQAIAVVNKAGGASTIGLAEVFTANPDGYTLGVTTTAPIAVQPHFGQTPYSHDSFKTIMRVQSDAGVMIVKADAPWKTVDELLEYIRQNPDKFTHATPGVGSVPHIIMEAVNQAIGVKTKAVAFDGGGAIMNAVLGGHVQGAIVQIPLAKMRMDDGQVRVLFSSGTKKYPPFEDLPLLSEKGVDVAIDTTTGLIAPKDTPEEVINILHDSFKKALEDPEVIKELNKIGSPANYAGPVEYQKSITDSFKLTGDILKKINLIK